MKVFISSVEKELSKERIVAKEAILQLNQEPYSNLLKIYLEENEAFEPVLSEAFGSRTSSVRETYLNEVKESNTYLGIIGKKYGTKLGSGLSATHEEYKRALTLKRNGEDKEILVYVKKIDERIDVREKEAKDFIEEVRSAHTYSNFENEYDLKDKIKTDILRIIVRRSELRKDIIKRKISNKIEEIVEVEKEGGFPEIKNLIDDLVAIVKKEIDEYRPENVEYAVKELIRELYPTHISLYSIIDDIINLGLKTGSRIPSGVIYSIERVMMDNWLYHYDLELAEKCSDTLLRISLNNLNKNIELSISCFYCLDEVAGEMFEEVIFSRVILLAAALEKIGDKIVNWKELKKTIRHYIKWDDIYSHDVDRYDYLINSIEYAEKIQNDYKIDIKPFKEKYLFGIIEEIKNKEVKNLVDFFEDEIYEGKRSDAFDILFCSELTEKNILAYGIIYPKVYKEIVNGVNEKSDQRLSKFFNKIINSNNYLKNVFKGEEMITSIDELIQAIRKNSHFETSEVGIGLWGLTFIRFKYPLKEEEKQELGNLAYRYGISASDEFEIDEDLMTFLMDAIVYGEGRAGVEKLIRFLKELDEKIRIKEISTGIEFKFKPFTPSEEK